MYKDLVLDFVFVVRLVELLEVLELVELLEVLEALELVELVEEVESVVELVLLVELVEVETVVLFVERVLVVLEDVVVAFRGLVVDVEVLRVFDVLVELVDDVFRFLVDVLLEVLVVCSVDEVLVVRVVVMDELTTRDLEVTHLVASARKYVNVQDSFFPLNVFPLLTNVVEVGMTLLQAGWSRMLDSKQDVLFLLH